MNAHQSEAERLLQAQLDEAVAAERALRNELAAVDAEREELAEQSAQYGALARACEALDELEEGGASQLFWGEHADSQAARERVKTARREAAAFSAHVARLNGRRQDIVDRIHGQNEVLDDLQYDLQSEIRQEERRRNNWVVERERSWGPYRPQVMPWQRGFEEDRRFRRSLAASVLLSVGLGFVFATIVLPATETDKVADLPERVARLVQKDRLPPPPPEPVEREIVPDEPVPEPVREPEPEAAPVLADETPEAPPPAAAVADVPQPAAKDRVKSKGILAFRDSFANRASDRPAARLGTQANLSNAGQTAVGRSERSMVTTSAPGSSGGINLATISRDVGGGEQSMAGVAVNRVASSIGGGTGPDRPLSGSHSAGRTDEEIQIVFDRYKAALYRLYNRQLRKNPTLRGQLVLRLVIEPNGSVSLCQVENSRLGAPTLEQQIVERVLTFDFGAKPDIATMTIIYPIDFLPAA